MFENRRLLSGNETSHFSTGKFVRENNFHFYPESRTDSGI